MSVVESGTVEVAEAGTLRINDCSVDCPHCGAAQEGWIVDPRNRVHVCDDCGKPYRVRADARLGF